MLIKEIHEFFLSSQGVCTDTRKLQKGQLFIALKGPNFNANELADEAIKKGAILAIIDDDQFNKANDKYLLVEDGLATLQQLANYHRHYLNTPLIGITGSNGKTSTKELIYQVLLKKYKVLATAGNYNNHIGVPLTLLSLTKNHQIGIIEMGANHVGEIAELCEIADINYGLLTGIGKAHLEGFGSIENIKKTKRAIYDYSLANEGKCFVNESIEVVRKLFDGTQDQLISYGTNGNFEIVIIDHSDSGIVVRLQHHGELLTVPTQMFGDYNALNVVSALAVGKHFEVSISDMIDAISNYIPDNNRSQVKNFKGGKFIMDAYNANPTSMHLAIESLASENSSEKIVILGDMAELGNDSEVEHNAIIELIEELDIRAILIGHQFYNAKKSKHCTKFKTLTEAKEHISQLDFSSKTILVKGSRSSALEKLFD